MKDFASFASENAPDADFVREANEVLKQYSGKSDAEIVKAIYARAVEGKKNGTLTNEQIDAFYEQFSPMLDGLKRRRLKKLVDELKKM